MKTFLLSAIVIFTNCAAFAQDRTIDISDKPICFVVVNTTPYTVYGDMSTDKFPAPSGKLESHKAVFRLRPKGTKGKGDNMLDRSRGCTTGPFFPDRKLELTIRTLIPVFSCRTSLDKGDILIKSERNAQGDLRTWAECF